MLSHRKLFLASALLFAALSLAACGHTGKEGASSAAEPAWAEISQWPDNEFTRHIPQPEAGNPVRFTQGSSAEYDFFSLELAGINLEDCRAYLQTVKDTGFSPVSELEEEVSPGSVSIVNVYSKNETGLSLAYSSGSEGLILYISRPASKA